MSQKLEAGGPMPELALPKVGGGDVKIGGKGRWQLVVVYRGKHCPLCKAYLGKLEDLQSDYAAVDTEIVAISGDPEEKAAAVTADWGLDFPVGYGLSVDQMRTLGLYVSNPRSPEETDRPFAEPGVFLVNPDGQLHIVDISNAPFARPDLEQLAKSIGFIREKGYPIRGTG